VATTSPESNVKGTSATLNGTAGAGVVGGAPTTFHFEYGTTTAYGTSTTPQTLGACPAGTNPPSPYCTTPAQTNVSAAISGLQPCTTYHDRIVSTNADGTTDGSDSAFTTGFANPISKVKFPSHVKANKKFKVQITLKFKAQVKIVIRKKGHAVKTIKLGTKNPGKISKKIKAPSKGGKYTLRVVAKLSCGSQTVDKTLHVKKHKKHHKKKHHK
jgi:hypothetical protein